MIPANCSVVRDSLLSFQPASDLMPGDVVYVKMGDKIPADLYIFYAADFKVDNSSLTGESDPQERFNHNKHENILEATNLAFNGTLAVSGEAYGIVIRIGDQTVLGQIANITQCESKRHSPLSQEIDRFVKIIFAISSSTTLLFFIVYIILNPNQATTARISGALNFAIGVLVAWVPQGLPATVSIILSLAAKRMAMKNVLVKDLQGVETLGAITLLATDKTGTLTRNQMTLSNVWASQNMMSLEESEASLNASEIPFSDIVSGVEEIIYIGAMCSCAKFNSITIPINDRLVFGDATESGLFRFSASKLSKNAKTGEAPEIDLVSILNLAL